MSSWIKSRTSEIGNSGLVVIESDDGTRGDYTHWFPLIYNKSLEYSGWFPPRLAVVCPNINTGNIGNDNRMSWSEIRELYRMGWEINSHGQYHTGLGKYNLTEAASVGDETILANTSWFGVLGGYEYMITNGESSEFFGVDSTSSGVISIDKPLENNWDSDCWVELSEKGKTDLLQGAIDDINAHDIPCRHHVYTYHAGSEHQFNPASVEKVGELFLSGRGRQGDLNNAQTDLRRMRSRLITSSLATTTIDDILDDCVQNDEVAIFYGHGETSSDVLSLLEYIIDGSISRGIRIGTRQVAYEKLSQ